MQTTCKYTQFNTYFKSGIKVINIFKWNKTSKSKSTTKEINFDHKLQNDKKADVTSLHNVIHHCTMYLPAVYKKWNCPVLVMLIHLFQKLKNRGAMLRDVFIWPSGVVELNQLTSAFPLKRMFQNVHWSNFCCQEKKKITPVQNYICLSIATAETVSVCE